MKYEEFLNPPRVFTLKKDVKKAWIERSLVPWDVIIFKGEKVSIIPRGECIELVPLKEGESKYINIL